MRKIEGEEKKKLQSNIRKAAQKYQEERFSKSTKAPKKKAK